MSQTGKINNKIAIVTGSSNGIGLDISGELLEKGYRVIGLDKTENKELSSEYFCDVVIDLLRYVREKEYREKQSKRLLSEMGQGTEKVVLINNAAYQYVKSIDDIDLEEFRKSMDINVTAPLMLVKTLLTHLRHNNGVILNISSIHSKLTKKGFLSYSVSKAALDGLTRALSLELASDSVTINSIAPAAINTEMLREGFNETPEKLCELNNYHPAGSIGEPKNLANFVLKLIELEDGFLTGSVIDYHGGIGVRLHDPS